MGIKIRAGRNDFAMNFRIEKRPDGTFAGICDEPKLEITGSTREEILQKVQQTVGSRLLEKFGVEAQAIAEADGINVKIKKTLSVTKISRDGTKSVLISSGDSSSPTGDDGMPAMPKPIDAGSWVSQELITAFLVLAAIGLLVWWFFLHK